LDSTKFVFILYNQSKKGFIADFASIPRIFWPIVSPWDKYGKAAILHDYVCHTQMFPKRTCDAIFKNAMVILGVPKWKQFLLFIGVKYFGWLVALTAKNKNLNPNIF